MNILLAEDDEKLGKLIVHMLKKQFHTADWVKNGQDAYDYAKASNYQLLLLDWMLPGKDGVALCRQLRKEGYANGILMLTAKDELSDIIAGLDSGADDYIVKPFKFEELFARIRSVARRLENRIQEATLEIPPFVLSLSEHTLLKDGSDIPLTVREFQLVELLMRNCGRTVARETLLAAIWGLDAEVTDNSLDALVRLVRKKLGGDARIRLQNVRGIGFKLEVAHVCPNEN